MGSLRHPRAFCIGQSGGLGPKKGLRPQGRGQRVEGTEVGIEWGGPGGGCGVGRALWGQGSVPRCQGSVLGHQGSVPRGSQGLVLGGQALCQVARGSCWGSRGQ